MVIYPTVGRTWVFIRVVNMPPCKLDLDLYEDNLLDSCWRVGASRPRAGGFSSFDRSEIAAVDIVACWLVIIYLATYTY